MKFIVLATTLWASTAVATPVVRFAIDQDYYPGKQSVARVAEDFILAHRISVGIIRTGIGWDDTNPRPDTYRWGFWHQVIARARGARVEIRPYYAYTPSWAGHAYNAPPRSDADFARACGVMAETIGTLVPSLEIWNEPDNTAFWTGTARDYGGLLAGCTHAIRSVRPAIPVVLGGLVYLDTPWLDRSGAAAPADYTIAAFHQYTETPWDATTVEQVSAPRAYDPGYDRLAQHGATEVWMDEGGATTDAAQGYSEQTQASWIRRTVASLLGQPGRPLSLFGLYQLRDLDPALSHPIGDPVARKFFRHTGIFTVDGRPKLAAATYGDLARLFDGHRPDVQDQLVYQPSSGLPSQAFRLYAWRFEDGRQAVMIWDRRIGSAGQIVLRSPARAAWLHRVDGAVVRIAAFDGRHLQVPRLEAGATPLLFELR